MHTPRPECMHMPCHAQVDALMSLAAEKLEELADKEGFLNRNQIRIQVCTDALTDTACMVWYPIISVQCMGTHSHSHTILEHSVFCDSEARAQVLGDFSRLPEHVQRAATRAMQTTSHHKRAILNICLAYTSRQVKPENSGM
jgi:undecaprenyl pyrophosphate synthase